MSGFDVNSRNGFREHTLKILLNFQKFFFNENRRISWFHNYHDDLFEDALSSTCDLYVYMCPATLKAAASVASTFKSPSDHGPYYYLA